MVFNSIDFLIFFPIVVGIFFLVPKKIRYIWLLIASYYFYMGWNTKYAFLLALSTVITYVVSLFICLCEKNCNVVGKRIFLWGGVLANLGILGIFKYANFFLNNFNIIFVRMGFKPIESRLDLLLPVGISFYTFQALSYTLDVYYGKIETEKNIFKYALYVSFFPQLVAGPIERSVKLLPQIQNIENINVWNYERIRDGLLLMMWGLFQKLIIADRASLLVDNVVNNYTNYGFVEIIIAIILFAIQIYCDFNGYTNIAIGAARVMGFRLMNNFRQPYLAVSIRGFWRRWHISLTSWFTDYLYIPLGGSHRGILRKYINIIIVFSISGLWHGASWNYVVWGLLHAFFQIVGDIKNKNIDRGNKEDMKLSTRIRKCLCTFVIVDFSWIFFVSNGLSHSIDLIKQMISCFQTTDIYELGLDRGNWFFLMFGILVLFIVDVLHEKGISIYKVVNSQETWFRWGVYLGLIWIIIMFGIYGIAYDASTFIYFQF